MPVSLIAWTGTLWVLWCLWRRPPAGVRHVLATAMVAGIMLCTPLGANQLVRLLEAPVSPLPDCVREADRPLVVLAGGMLRPARAADDFAALGEDSLRRVFGLLSVLEEVEGRSLFFVGGGQTISTAEVMATLATALGPADGRPGVEPASRSTWENAARLAALLPPGRVVLLTSALHMKRAMLAFERQGFEVCPLAVDSRFVPFGGLGYLIPQHSAVSKAEAALHELAGRLVYAFR